MKAPLPFRPAALLAAAAAALACTSMPVAPDVRQWRSGPPGRVAVVMPVVDKVLAKCPGHRWVVSLVDLSTKKMEYRYAGDAELPKYLPAGDQVSCSSDFCPRVTVLVSPSMFQPAIQSKGGPATSAGALTEGEAGDPCSGNPVEGSGGNKGITTRVVEKIAEDADGNTGSALSGTGQ